MSAIPIPFPRSPAVAQSLVRPLPVPSTPLLGRNDDVARVMTLVDRDDLRVVTLLGPGGVGKTRLALEVAYRIGTHFANGAAFVPLETVRHSAGVPDAVALALGIPTQPGRDSRDLLADILAGWHLLLVLDNCEQVVAAAPWLATLVMRCPRLRVLATSRRPLTVAGEQQVRVAPLPVPASDGARTAAVDLFIERGLAANFDLVLDTPNLQAIADICRTLDGLPLAIELAAARVTMLSPQALLARLTHRLAMLTGQRGDAPARQRSMRASIGWSYDLLEPDSQRLLRKVSVFVGVFSLEAAAFIVAWPDRPHDDGAVVDLIQILVDHNLVQLVPGACEPRYRMLETIREYGQEEATGRGEIDIAFSAHADYVVSLAMMAERQLTGPDQGMWLERLEVDYPNVLAAIGWLDDQHRVVDAIGIICAIQWFLMVRGHAVEMIGRLEHWHGYPDIEGLDRARLLHALGGLKQVTGSFRESVAMLGEAAGIYRERGDSLHESMAHALLVETLYMSSDVDSLRDAAPKALALARGAGDHRGVCSNLHYLARRAEFLGDVKGAWLLYDEAHRVAVQYGDTWARAFHVRMQAWEAASAGRFDDAERLAIEAKDMFEVLGARRELSGDWAQLAKIALARGDFEAAASRIDAGLVIARACGYDWYISAWLQVSGMIDVARGELAAASEALKTALRVLDDPILQCLDTAACLSAFALLAARAGDPAQAARFYAASKRLTREAGIDAGLPPTEVDEIWLDRALREALGRQEMKRALRESDAISVQDVVSEAMTYDVPASQTAPERPYGLSAREMDVLQLMANGYSNQQIADELFIALRTVTSHVTGILAKLEVPSRTAAVSYAIRERLV